jgi:hypothetical protein
MNILAVKSIDDKVWNGGQKSFQEQTLQLPLQRKHSPITTRKIWSPFCPALLIIIQIELNKSQPVSIKQFSKC